MKRTKKILLNYEICDQPFQQRPKKKKKRKKCKFTRLKRRKAASYRFPARQRDGEKKY